ncbi:MAG: methylenetetrahydrofolate reductase C-terminal domain-containing protein [Propionibacteriaceae bacterium]
MSPVVADQSGRLPPPVRPGCPKQMVYGPCGGVRVDGRCEMAERPCVFGDLAEAVPVGRVEGGPPTAVPTVLTDLSTPPADAATLRSTAARLAPSCDAVLLGDHQDRADFPPSMLARLVADAGAVPWVTMACRDRNRVVLEQELHGLAHDAVATLLAVTGDGRAFDVRPEVSQVFDLDSTRLTVLAAAVGVPVAVTETPAAPPVGVRPGRLVQKERAGARGAVLNHVSGAAEVDRFVRAARARGLTIPVIASVPVYTDERSAAVLEALPGLALDHSAVARVLAAADPVAAGIASAVALAAELMAVEGVQGVNLSGMASARSVAYAAEIQAEIGHRIRAEVRR